VVKRNDLIAARNNLARLLATERLWVRHQNVSTASFDTIRRILTLPNWVDVSEHVYTLLNGHEVGHAKYTPTDWHDQAVKIDPKNAGLAAAYVNIICDARIERLMKETFPGLTATFSQAYEELFHRKFFGDIDPATVNSRPFIDRINLYFKVGFHVKIVFTSAEQLLIDKVARTITFDDVIAVTREVYQHAKQEQSAASSDLTSTDPQKGKATDKEGNDAAASSSSKEPSEDGDGKSGFSSDEGSGTQTSDGDGTKVPSTESPEDGKKPKDGKAKDQNKPAPASKGPGKTSSSTPAMPSTQKDFDTNLQTLMDKRTHVVYVKTPLPNLDKLTKDYTSTHDAIRRHFKDVTQAEADFATFQKLNVRKVNYIVQQFEMRKQADRYQRIKLHKTGALDVLRLHEYKYTDDLFRAVATTAKGKNHGLVFIVDWSGSMSSIMAGTLQQLIVLCMFCRKAHIPFEVYGVTDHGSGAFQQEPETLEFLDRLSLVNFLSSRMSQRQFFDASVNLFALMPNGVWKGGPKVASLCTCTPLDEAVVGAMSLVHEFRTKNKIQIVNAVFLTDGDANTVSRYRTDTMSLKSMNGYEQFLLEDRLTHKTYEFNASNLTPTLLRVMRDRENINVVGFYVGGSSYFRHFFPLADAMKQTVLEQQLKSDGFVISTEWGYDELYITDVVVPQDKEIHASTEKESLSQSFLNERTATSKERIMLTSFVKMIA
jgi:hypothetical protein